MDRLTSEVSYPLPKTDKTLLQRFAERTLKRVFQAFSHGTLTLHEGGDSITFGTHPTPGYSAEITVHDGEFYPSVLFGGSIGAGESFMRGDWSSDDLTGVVRLLSRNMDVVDKMDSGLAKLGAPLLKLAHFLRKNTRDGARENIAAHYDLGNAFFETFLDPTMCYSAATFPSDVASLEEASCYKLDRICQKLRLSPDDHLLEIGTGWGGLAIHAAQHYGCRVTTTTISKEQLAYAREQVDKAGLNNRIELLFEDYRDLQGRFDKVVSIEMIEAVGHHYLETYFQKISSLLQPEGLALIQAITIPDDRYHRALKEVDFIKRYIFPGSFIPSIGAMLDATGKRTDLRLVHFEDQAEHYARTLNAWRQNFEANRHHPAVTSFPEHFRRMWSFYFSYCEGAFIERIIGSAQLLFAKPLNRDPHLLHPFSQPNA